MRDERRNILQKKINEHILNPTSLESIQELSASAIQDLSNISDLEKLEEWRVSYLGRRGKLTSMLRGLSELGIEDKKTVGNLANQSKAQLEQLFEQPFAKNLSLQNLMVHFRKEK